MSASLVGSEMCIRDRARPSRAALRTSSFSRLRRLRSPGSQKGSRRSRCTCLLYTSDAADDM
eukprot:3112-Alexandrium_andersonii.AAC.1